MFGISSRAMATFGAIASVAVLTAACAGGSGGAGGNTVKAKKGGFAFEPNEITVEAGKSVTLNFENPDAVVHDLVIKGLDKEYKAEAQPGKSATVTFTAAKAGTYQIICSQAGHEAAGMVGKLIVK